MTEFYVEGIEFPTADEAIQHMNASGFGPAIRIGGKNFVVTEAEAERLEAARIAFSYLHDHEGLIVTIPTNGFLTVAFKERPED